MENVLKPIEDRFVVFDFSELSRFCLLLAALKVRVHLAGVGWILFVMCDLQERNYNMLHTIHKLKEP